MDFALVNDFGFVSTFYTNLEEPWITFNSKNTTIMISYFMVRNKDLDSYENCEVVLG